jgi:hypothetical protein
METIDYYKRFKQESPDYFYALFEVRYSLLAGAKFKQSKSEVMMDINGIAFLVEAYKRDVRTFFDVVETDEVDKLLDIIDVVDGRMEALIPHFGELIDGLKEGLQQQLDKKGIDLQSNEDSSNEEE